MRTYNHSRGLVSDAQSRGRIASLIAREPVLVTVSRYPAGSGVSGPKVLTEHVSFIGRLEESRKSALVTSTDAYTNLPTQWLLITLRDNDATDGISGSPIDIKTDDRVTIRDYESRILGTFTVSGVQALRSHNEIILQQRT